MANKLFQNALKKVQQKVPPIWFMRQAGRYHSHYQKLKEKYSFVQLCKEPELSAETAMGPIQDFDFDISILFSDLLFPLEAMGMGLEYKPGPQLDRQLTEANIAQLKPIDEAIEGLYFQKQALQATRERLPKDKSLIGFVGGPWTLYTYACEGGHKGNLIQSKNQLPLFEKLCESLVPLLIQNIQLQLDGGAELVMVLDTSSGELSSTAFNHWILPQLDRIAQAHPHKLMYYSKGTTRDHLDSLWDHSHWVGLGLDHRWNLSNVLKQKKRGAIQGNFDQCQLFSDSSLLHKELDRYLGPLEELSLEERAGWICGLGHGVLPQTPENHVRYIVDSIRERFS